jgi:hypothetical protein
LRKGKVNSLNMEVVDAVLTISERLVAVKKRITSEDIARAALVGSKHRVTVEKYLKGDVPDEELGTKLAEFFEACAEINDEMKERKEKLVF